MTSDEKLAAIETLLTKYRLWLGDAPTLECVDYETTFHELLQALEAILNSL